MAFNDGEEYIEEMNFSYYDIENDDIENDDIENSNNKNEFQNENLDIEYIKSSIFRNIIFLILEKISKDKDICEEKFLNADYRLIYLKVFNYLTNNISNNISDNDISDNDIEIFFNFIKSDFFNKIYNEIINDEKGSLYLFSHLEPNYLEDIFNNIENLKLFLTIKNNSKNIERILKLNDFENGKSYSIDSTGDFLIEIDNNFYKFFKKISDDIFLITDNDGKIIIYNIKKKLFLFDGKKFDLFDDINKNNQFDNIFIIIENGKEKIIDFDDLLIDNLDEIQGDYSIDIKNSFKNRDDEIILVIKNNDKGIYGYYNYRKKSFYKGEINIDNFTGEILSDGQGNIFTKVSLDDGPNGIYDIKVGQYLKGEFHHIEFSKSLNHNGEIIVYIEKDNYFLSKGLYNLTKLKLDVYDHLNIDYEKNSFSYIKGFLFKRFEKVEL